jgi:hypothetical protein
MNSHRASSDPTASPEADEIARLAGELLHDLNDALAAHAALIELARLEAQRGTTPGTMERLEGSIRHLQAMVRDLFDEIRPGHASPEIEFDPCEEAQAAFERWRLTAPALRLSFQCDVPAELAIRGRASFFTRVLTNLLRNAAQHATALVAARIEVHTEDGQHWLHLLVEDDGPGVPLALRERVFEPYVHGSERGTGLGLSMTRWGVRRLGGSVELVPESLLGGARFLVRLPVSTRTAPEEPTVSPSVDASLAGVRIAYVDDYVALARGFARLAEREGADWIHILPNAYTDPEQLARELLTADVGVIVLDYHLGRYTGIDVHAQLSALSPDLADRVLFSSGDLPPTSTDVPELADRWVVKGGGWAALRARILTLLNNP